jgi:uncharacterized membrane protein YsdA (DUF1294 family)/cold shock CspA family protein
MASGTALDGLLVRWDDSRGFGFVRVPDGADVFVHVTDFPRGGARPVRGDRVAVVATSGADGRRKAVSARLVGVRRMPRAGGVLATLGLLAAAVVLAVLLGGLGGVGAWLAGLGAAASVVAFALYAADKRAARLGRWRVPEATLLGVGLVGGWPGAFVAQQLLRHKTRKRSFRLAFWGTVVGNVAVVVLVLSVLG